MLVAHRANIDLETGLFPTEDLSLAAGLAQLDASGSHQGQTRNRPQDLEDVKALEATSKHDDE